MAWHTKWCPKTGRISISFQVLVVVTKVEEDGITIDQNHPLAGMTLFFDVKVGSIRNASEEELTQGHI